MGVKSRFKIKSQQEKKRRARRAKLTKAKQNPDQLFYGGTWVGGAKK